MAEDGTKNTLEAKIHTLKGTAQRNGTSIAMPRIAPVRLVFVAVNRNPIPARELPQTESFLSKETCSDALKPILKSMSPGRRGCKPVFGKDHR